MQCLQCVSTLLNVCQLFSKPAIHACDFELWVLDSICKFLAGVLWSATITSLFCREVWCKCKCRCKSFEIGLTMVLIGKVLMEKILCVFLMNLRRWCPMSNMLYCWQAHIKHRPVHLKDLSSISSRYWVYDISEPYCKLILCVQDRRSQSRFYNSLQNKIYQGNWTVFSLTSEISLMATGSQKTLSGAAIAGIVIGSLFLLSVAIALPIYFLRRRPPKRVRTPLKDLSRAIHEAHIKDFSVILSIKWNIHGMMKTKGTALSSALTSLE